MQQLLRLIHPGRIIVIHPCPFFFAHTETPPPTAVPTALTAAPTAAPTSSPTQGRVSPTCFPPTRRRGFGIVYFTAHSPEDAAVAFVPLSLHLSSHRPRI